jgi:hypothetical protein
VTVTATVVIELCHSNSIGPRYYEPSVVEYRTVTQEEAAEAVRRPMANGFFWRLMPEDRTGASG